VEGNFPALLRFISHFQEIFMITHRTLAAGSLALVISACASVQVDNASLPEAVRVPEGQVAKLWTLGAGDITYACRAKADQSGTYAWVFVAPVATLSDANKQVVGKYYAGPTWESNDGSKVTGKQVAVAPGGDGNIPLQLVKANPAMGSGAMSSVTYIQRLKTKGGVAPAAPCTMNNVGAEQMVPYQADYVFYVAK
jgi:Protein of unknown function (DUF3455)